MPEKPGSYQYYDENHTIIYVGKAKNLKRRVSSYFHKEVDRYKTKVLVSKIHDISYTVVNTEEDALLLENSLIKSIIKIQCPAERRQDIPLYMRNKRVFSTHFQDSSYQQKSGNLLRSLPSYRQHVCRFRGHQEAL